MDLSGFLLQNDSRMHQLKNGPTLAITPSMVLRFHLRARNQSSIIPGSSWWHWSCPKAPVKISSTDRICFNDLGLSCWCFLISRKAWTASSTCLGVKSEAGKRIPVWCVSMISCRSWKLNCFQNWSVGSWIKPVIQVRASTLVRKKRWVRFHSTVAETHHLKLPWLMTFRIVTKFPLTSANKIWRNLAQEV